MTNTTSQPAATRPTTSSDAKSNSSCHARGSGLYVLPDPHCTPGATNPAVTQANIDSTICKAGWSESQRPPESVTEEQKRLSLAAYGYYDGRSLHTYEFDHLIPLELGGASDSPRNLWPEPDYPGVSDNSYYLNPKDHVEDELHDWVCSGKISLGCRPAHHRHELDQLVPRAYRADHHSAGRSTGQDHARDCRSRARRPRPPAA